MTVSMSGERLFRLSDKRMTLLPLPLLGTQRASFPALRSSLDKTVIERSSLLL